jgi:ABC-2 type transport system permease protein
MKGLLLKDFITMSKNSRTVFFIIAFFMFFGFALRGTTDLIQLMIVLLCSTMVINSFSCDAAAKWDKYVLSLPVTRKDVVLSKYILALILTGIGTVISLLMNTVFGIMNDSGDQTEILMKCYTLFAVSMIFLCLLLPLIFRFGVEKSRLFMLLVYIIPLIILIMLTESGVLQMSESIFLLILKLSPLVLLAVFWASYQISCRIYRNMDV